MNILHETDKELTMKAYTERLPGPSCCQPHIDTYWSTGANQVSKTTDKSPLEDEIRAVCNELADFLVEKNRKYGNSASAPVRIFSKADAKEQIRVRIDDKLSRLISSQSDEDEDVVNDLLGYLILLKINTESEK